MRIFVPDWSITQVIKPSVTTANLKLGRNPAALDKEIAAVASHSDFQKVFAYDISVIPAEELAILNSPDNTSTDYFGFSVAVSRDFGILVGAYGRT